MKRSPALILLSRDHHHALDAARRLRRAQSADLDAAVAHLSAFWEPRGRRHFEIEERLILPAVPQSDTEWHGAATRVREEHARIRAGVEALCGGAASVADARELGQLLHDHVRFEERDLFALLEARLEEEELGALGDAVEAAHG
jgi:hemerythrin-like domain-containing protein